MTPIRWPRMDGLTLIGISHNQGGLEELDRWKREQAQPWLEQLDALDLNERVLLDTCNRWDLVVNAPDQDKLEATIPGNAKLYVYRGEAAYAQLIRVSASLDSLSPGESQITAQVRRAYADAAEAGSLGKPLHFAFQSALRAAKHIRSELDLTTGETSLFSLARPHLSEAIADDAPITILGAGEMGAAAAHNLARDSRHKLTIANRTVAMASGLAQATGATATSLQEFLDNPTPSAALVCTLGGDTRLGREQLALIPGLKLIIDLGAPRNVPEEAVPEGVQSIGIKDLQAAGAEQRALLAGKISRGEEMVLEETATAVEEWTERQLAETIVRIRSHYRERVAELMPVEQADSVASRLARPQIAGLRALARRYGLEAAEAFMEGAGI